MARFKVVGINVSEVTPNGQPTAPVYTVTLQPDGGSADQAIRVTAPAGSYIEQMTYGQFYNLNQQAGKYKVAGFSCSEVTTGGVTFPIYTVVFRSTAPGSTSAQDVRLTGPAGSQIATEAMRYGFDFDIVPS